MLESQVKKLSLNRIFVLKKLDVIVRAVSAGIGVVFILNLGMFL